MNLLVNQLFCWHSDDKADIQIDRLLWLDSTGTDVVTIDIYNPKAQLIWHKYKDIEAIFTANIASIMQDAPYAEILLPNSELSEVQRDYRDKAWSAIAPIIAKGELVFYTREQG